MKAGTFGEFIVSARGIQQGDRWIGSYKIHQTALNSTVSTVFRDDEMTEDTFQTRQEATNAAFDEGVKALDSIMRRRRK